MEKSPKAFPISQKGLKSSLVKILAFYFCFFFLLFFSIPFFLTVIRPLPNLISSLNWKETPCTVISCEPNTAGAGINGVNIQYRYEHAGLNYESTRYSFLSGSKNYEEVAELTKRLKPGTVAICYVNPNDPTQAVIENRWELISSHLSLLTLSLVYLTAALVFFVLLFDWLRQRKSPTELAKETPISTVESIPVEVGGFSPVIKKTSNKKAFLFLVVFTICLCGMFGVGIWQALIKPGKTPLIPLIIFGAIFGLLSLGLTIHAGLKLLNPQIQLSTNPTQLSIGEKFSLKWGLSGRADKIQKFQIKLQGQELISYTVSNSSIGSKSRRHTVTKTNSFFEASMIETEKKREMEFGTTEFTIPDNLVPSLEAGSSQIRWSILVHGEIPGFPDIEEEFPLHVFASKQRV